MRKFYSGIEEETGKLHSVKVSHDDYHRANKIFRDNDIPLRTTKWFRLITEKQIQSDISGTGSDKFRLDWDSAMDIGMQLKNGA